MKKKVIAVVSFILVAAPIAALISWFVYNNVHFETKEYTLSEVEPGTYCVYSVASSRVPAENYQMVTLCCNGQIATFKGDVTVIYSPTNSRAIVEDYDIINGDNITVYVPRDTVKFQENIGIG